MPDTNDEHYLRSVAQLGDAQPVVTRQPIYAGNRVKLVDQGVRIDSSLYERIVRHKLLMPLEQCLAAESTVTIAEVADRANQVLARAVQVGVIASVLGEGADLNRVFGDFELPAPVAFKLTVARDVRPAIFAHGIDVALLAVYLARRSGGSPQDVRAAALAGLLHDLGELHMDPSLVAQGRALSESERRHVYAHPLTASLFLAEFPALRPLVSTAVAEHHERLDGSGYPRGIAGAEISRLGRILMLAEVVAALVRASWNVHRAARIVMVLKVGRQKFDRALLSQITPMFGPAAQGENAPAASGTEAQPAQVAAAITRLGAALRDWEELYRARVPGGGAAAVDPLLGFVDLRVAGLAQILLEAGFDFHDSAAFLAAIAEDASLREETALFAREALWQLREIMLELRRRWSEFQAGAPGNCAAVQGWLERHADQAAAVSSEQ